MFDPINRTAKTEASDNSQVRIDTPENVLLDADVAGFASRALASMVDYLILGIALLILTLTVLPSLVRNPNPGITVALTVLIQFIIITFYHLTFEFLWNGQTPGKRAFGLRVVMTNGLPLTTSAALIRNIIRLFDFLPLFYGVGLVSLFATKKTQRLGDLAANTIVIREKRDVDLKTLNETKRFVYRYINAYTQIPPYIQPAQLSEADIELLVNYLSRRDNAPSYDPTARLIGERLARSMGTIRPGEQVLPAPGTFLEMVARALELAKVDPAQAQSATSSNPSNVGSSASKSAPNEEVISPF